MHHPIRVLFVCDGGASRSLMAEALLRARADGRFEVHSAGLEPEAPATAAIETMREIGIELPASPVHHLNDFEQQQFDYLITLCDEAMESCIAFQRDGHNLHWSCPDPGEAAGTEELLDAYRALRDRLQRQIGEWAVSLGNG